MQERWRHRNGRNCLDPVDYAVICQAHDRDRPRDGRQAHPLRLFDHLARGPGRIGRSLRREGQRRRPGRADPDAPRLDVGDLPRLRRGVPVEDAASTATSTSTTILTGAASTCRTCSSSRRSSVDGDHRLRRARWRIISISAAAIPASLPDAVDVHAEGHHPAVRYTLSATGTAGPSSGWSRPISACPRRPSAICTPSSPQTRSAHRTRAASSAGIRRAAGRGDNARADGLFGAPLPGRDRPSRTASIMARMRSTTTGSTTPPAVKARGHHRGRSDRGRFRRHLPQVRRNLNCPIRLDHVGSARRLKSVLTSPDIPFNEGFTAADRRDRAARAPWSTPTPAPVRARLQPGLPLLQCGAQGAGPGGARPGYRGRQRHAPQCARHLVSRPSTGTASIWRSLAADLAPRRATTDATRSTARYPIAPTRRSKRPTWTSNISGSSAMASFRIPAGMDGIAAVSASSGVSRS